MDDIADQIVEKVMKEVACYGSTEQYNLVGEVCGKLYNKMDSIMCEEYLGKEDENE